MKCGSQSCDIGFLVCMCVCVLLCSILLSCDVCQSAEILLVDVLRLLLLSNKL